MVYFKELAHTTMGMASLKSEFVGQASRLETQAGIFYHYHPEVELLLVQEICFCSMAFNRLHEAQPHYCFSF